MKTIQVYHYGELPHDARYAWRQATFKRLATQYREAGIEEGEILEILSTRMEGEAARAAFVKIEGNYYELAKDGYPMPDMEA